MSDKTSDTDKASDTDKTSDTIEIRVKEIIERQ